MAVKLDGLGLIMQLVQYAISRAYIIQLTSNERVQGKNGQGSTTFLKVKEDLCMLSGKIHIVACRSAPEV